MKSEQFQTVAPQLASASSSLKGDFALHPEPATSDKRQATSDKRQATSDTERKSLKGTPLFWILLGFFFFNSGSVFSQTSCTPNNLCSTPFVPNVTYSASFPLNVSPPPGSHILLLGDLIITGTVNFTGCLVKVPINSSIFIFPGGSLTLDGSCLNSLSLTDVWGGIRLAGNGSNLFVTNTTIQNAETGIYVEPCGYFELNGGNVMLNNLDHIVIEPCNNTNSNIVYGTCFTSTSLLNNSAGYARSRYGINFLLTIPLSNMPVNTFMNVGEPLQNENIFEFCENGIYANGWNLTIKNNRFRQINPNMVSFSGGMFSGIWYNSLFSPRPFPQWQVTIGGGIGINNSNRFEDSYRGIQANDNGMNLLIYGNTFLRCSYDGVFVKNSYESDIKVNNNIFTDVSSSSIPSTQRAAIIMDNINTLNNPAVEIFQNVITTSNPNVYTIYSEQCGIHVQTMLNNVEYYYIWQNTISGKRAGIYLNNAVNAVAECNTINLATVPYSTNSNRVSVGINNYSSDGSLIIRNTISGTGTVGNFLPQSTGILNWISVNPTIFCNRTFSMMSHLENRFNNLPSELQYNEMQEGNQGLWLRATTTNPFAFIGTQGNSTWPAGNRWTGGWAGCAPVGTFGKLHCRELVTGITDYYHRTVTLEDPSSCNTSNTAIFFAPIPAWTAPLRCFACDDKPYQFNRILQVDSTGQDTSYESGEGERIATGQMQFDTLIDENTWWTEWNLVRMLDADTTGKVFESEYQDFINQADQLSKLAILKAIKYSNANNFEEAGNLLSQINNGYKFSSYFIDYLNTILNVGLRDYLEDSEYSSLVSLATLCPMDGGPATFYARNTLEEFTGEYIESSCEMDYSFEKQSKSNPNIKLTYVQSGIQILGIGNTEHVSLSIFDLNGKKVFETESNDTHYFELNLQNGLYIYQLNRYNTGEFISGKFSVIN